ncbi:hypothetical protein [Nonomuraea sp. NPDC049400]|uniref:hypothetical protein n=1 Tax=Nonomuraea sp. NPDC049400 TaxID=3364352 RepID=UPI00378FC481
MSGPEAFSIRLPAHVADNLRRIAGTKRTTPQRLLVQLAERASLYQDGQLILHDSSESL